MYVPSVYPVCLYLLFIFHFMLLFNVKIPKKHGGDD